MLQQRGGRPAFLKKPKRDWEERKGEKAFRRSKDKRGLTETKPLRKPSENEVVFLEKTSALSLDYAGERDGREVR